MNAQLPSRRRRFRRLAMLATLALTPLWAAAQESELPNPSASQWAVPTTAIDSGDYSLRPETPPLPAAPIAVPAVAAEKPRNATWYTRIDYLHWNERVDSADFVNEYGTFITVGYERRVGCERFRLELLGGDITYEGGAQFDDGHFEPYLASTNYLGGRIEYDLLFQPAAWPNTLLFAGLGTRAWIRDLKDAVTPSGAPVSGYQEDWWTIYPYLGAELKRPLSIGPEIYALGRLGVTAVTYEHVSYNDAALYPKPDLTGQIELGVRGPSLTAAVVLESMSWRASPAVRDSYQPDSRMYSIGGRLGYRF